MAQLLPEGTVTFLFSDVEGSTRLLERHGAAMGDALARHHGLFERIVQAHGGVIFETVGDAVYAAFQRPTDAVAAALDAHRALAAEDWGPIGRLAVRIAIHSGQVERRGDHYFGSALFRAARLQALGYGEQTLLSQATARLAVDKLPAGASLRDLGQHRLKDLGEPEQVYQLVHPEVRAEFPALKSLDAHPHNLPLQLSSFIGREVELAQVGELIDADRVVSLLGPGGIGKTRLGLQVAAERVERHPDGVWFVDLAALRDPEFVPSAIATSLGLRELPGQPIDATLAEHLRTRELLLVLDNMEQLLPAAAKTVAEMVSGASRLRIIATSRVPLRIRGEREYAVPPLSVGDPDQLEASPPAAVALFVERARAIGQEVAVDEQGGPLIAEICARCDGLPLAIELAASRLRMFKLPALRDRLAKRLPLLAGGARDLPERQQTLRSAIAWSEELLSVPERRLLARLGVFAGGFGLAAAEAVCGPDLGTDVIEALGALVEHSLLRPAEDVVDEPRYTMLETIREYALERLEASGEAEIVRDRHLAYHLDLAERAYGDRLAAESSWLAVLDREHDNFRAALDWAVERQPEAETQLLGALAPYWQQTGHAAEARRRLPGALERHPAQDRAGARALTHLAVILLLGRQPGAGEGGRDAEDSLREAIGLCQALGDPRGEALALETLGYTRTAAQDHEAAREAWSRASPFGGRPMRRRSRSRSR